MRFLKTSVFLADIGFSLCVAGLPVSSHSRKREGERARVCGKRARPLHRRPRPSEDGGREGGPVGVVVLLTSTTAGVIVFLTNSGRGGRARALGTGLKMISASPARKEPVLIKIAV